MKLTIGYLTLLGATIGFGYWYHLTRHPQIGLGCGVCLVVLIGVAVHMVTSD